jgi:hypothetical protein
MKVKLLFMLVLFIFLTSLVNAVHCWDISYNGTINPNMNWENKISLPQAINYNGNLVNDVLLIGGSMQPSGFGEFIFNCNNGDSRNRKPYVGLFIDSNKVCTNVSGCSPPNAFSDKLWEYCVMENGVAIRNSGDIIGLGNLDEIAQKQIFTNSSVGFHNYQIIRDRRAIAGMEQIQTPDIVKSGNFFVSAFPSLLIFGPENTKTGFYEKNGRYERDLIFTIHTKHILDINIMNYSINCIGNGVTCTIDDAQKGYVLSRNNDTIMVFGKAIIDKDNTPKEIVADLNVHYQIVSLRNTPPYNFGHYTQSKPTKIEIGFLDKQQFQIKIKSDKEMFNCAGADGIIGQTGPDLAPRINLTFGGNNLTDSSRTIGLDECNPKNTNWVYCSQSEFIISLSRKIAEIATKQSQLSSAMQASDRNQTLVDILNKEINDLENFEIATRDINVSTTSLTNSITNYINNQLSILTSASGLEGYTNEASFGGSDTTKQVARINSLFTGVNKIKFTAHDGDLTTPKFDAGIYNVKINFISSNGSFELFDNTTNIFDADLKIIIDLKQKSLPAYDWFFYDQGVEDILSQIIATEPTIGNSNVKNRGAIFKFEHTDNNNDFSNSTFWKTFATPLIAKISKDGNNIYNNFKISTDGGLGSLTDNTFTYWTGFASNKGEGCEDISPTQDDGYLVYNIPDTIIDPSNASSLDVEISEYNFIGGSSVEYLQSVIYLPYDTMKSSMSALDIDGNLAITTNNSTCTTLPCSVELKADNTIYKATNLQEVFNNIVSGKVCVSENRLGNKTNWKFFWNENEILKTLNPKKAEINDADICGSRIIQDN